MNETLRLLVFLPAEASEEEVTAGLAQVKAATAAPVDLTVGAAWYNRRIMACGDVETWAIEAVTGRSYATREPYFHAFVIAVGDAPMPAEAALVATLALRRAKSLYHLKEQKLHLVRRVEETTDGWIIPTGGHSV